MGEEEGIPPERKHVGVRSQHVDATLAGRGKANAEHAMEDSAVSNEHAISCSILVCIRPEERSERRSILHCYSGLLGMFCFLICKQNIIFLLDASD